MHPKFQLISLLAATAIFSAAAEEPKAPAPTTSPDKQNLSYALGMNLALDMKSVGVDLDADVVAQAIKDVLQERPTEIKEAEIMSIVRRAETLARDKKTSKYIAEGEAFLAKNAKADGITVLPDGLQYRVLKEGTGPLPRPVEIVYLRFRGTFIDGKEFRHSDNYEIPLWGCPKGLLEALKMMKVGSKWQIFEPYTLAYGHVKDRAEGYGSTLIYEIELLNAEAESAHPNQHHGAGRLGHTLDEDLLPAIFKSSAGGVN